MSVESRVEALERAVGGASPPAALASDLGALVGELTRRLEGLLAAHPDARAVVAGTRTHRVRWFLPADAPLTRRSLCSRPTWRAWGPRGPRRSGAA